MGGIWEMLKSQSFLEKALLLIITAVLSGFLIPFILQDITQKKFKEQKIFEAELLRQTKVLESQTEFFNIISEVISKFQLLALETAYYKSHKNKEKYELAFKKYDEQIWSLYTKIHYEIDKSRRLISLRIHKRFLEFYQDILTNQDSTLVNLVERGDTATDHEWNQFHQLVNTNAIKAREILYDLAQELGLTIESNQETKSRPR